MHYYSTDVGRWKIIVGIGMFSFVGTILVNSVLEQLLSPVALNGAISLTMFTISASLYYLYRKILWLPSGWFFESQVPALQGVWAITEDSSGVLTNDTENDGFRRLAIEQDWSKIQLDYYDKHRIYLRSDSAKISTLGPNNPEITFTCTGEMPDEDETGYKNVDGTFRLRYVRTSEGDRLIGHYYGNLLNNDSSRVEFRLRSRKLIRWRPEIEEAHPDEPSLAELGSQRYR